jgi:hypothetical protein
LLSLKEPPVISDQRCFAATRYSNPATYAQKKDRAVFADGPSQGGNAREGQRQRAIANVYFANQSATRIDGAQFLHAFLLHAFSDFAWPAHSPVLLPMTSAVVFLSTPRLGTMTPVKVVTIRST